MQAFPWIYHPPILQVLCAIDYSYQVQINWLSFKALDLTFTELAGNKTYKEHCSCLTCLNSVYFIPILYLASRTNQVRVSTKPIAFLPISLLLSFCFYPIPMHHICLYVCFKETNLQLYF